MADILEADRTRTHYIIVCTITDIHQTKSDLNHVLDNVLQVIFTVYLNDVVSGFHYYATLAYYFLR